ncbi:hypothetical protein DCAR_0417832 [Daucus carota subsp. sativus]|uniref:Uncharacterized protein n=1 Tax=Daucus carota subsp. sativus TaxID=79200 RepID=A0A165YYJ7_DAUCS|nr:hypothetical protein DCAR_0417832 [Daucus carota subsp. sativus]
MATNESENNICYSFEQVEKAEEQVNEEEVSQLCKDHCSGVSPPDGEKDREPTGEVACCDDGSGDKCRGGPQQDSHFKFKGME